MFGLPLSEEVDFSVVVQARCRIYFPSVVRWQYKLDCSEVFMVYLVLADPFEGEVSFLGRLSRDGRLTIPEVYVISLLRQAKAALGEYAKKSEVAALERGLVGLLGWVTLKPAKK